MSYNNGIITAPISVSDVQAVLGVDTSSIVSLCSSPKINKWSLRKPVVHSTIAAITDDQLKEANFGFSFGNNLGMPYSTPEALLADLKENKGWAYNAPNGNYASGNANVWQPCRIGDFRGYNHYAKPFIVGPGPIALDAVSQSYTFFARLEVITDLSWSTMKGVQGRYPCVVVFNSQGTAVGWKTSASPYGSVGTKTVTIKVSGTGADFTMQNNAQYTYMMCTASAPRTSFTGSYASNTNFLPIPADPNLYDILKYTVNPTNISVKVVGLIANDLVVNAGLTMPYVDPKPFMGPITVDADTEIGVVPYLGVGSSGRIGLIVEITNSGSTMASTSYIRVNATRTLNSTNSQTERPTIYLVNSLDTANGKVSLGEYEQQQLYIPSGGMGRYVLYLPYLLAMNDSGVATTLSVGAKASPIITMTWNDNNSNMNMGGMLRVKQGQSEQ